MVLIPCHAKQDLDQARSLVLQYGWNTTCYQILNPGMELWFSTAGDAVIGYVTQGHTRIVAGAPVCHVERLTSVLEEWHLELEALGFSVCYFGAEERLRTNLRQLPDFSVVTLGSQPVWAPESFVDVFRRDKTLRYQLNRAANKGVVVKEWESWRAAHNEDLASVLNQWLDTRGLPPMHFLVEPYTLDCLADRRVFVATRNDKPIAFVVLSPVPDRKGWLTEQFVRGDEAPNGTVELLLKFAIETACLEDARFVTMGIVPLTEPTPSINETNPRWLQWTMNWFRAHGRRFYNFDGLYNFKNKFRPDFWEPIYAISKEKEFSISTLYAVAGAFSQKPPPLVFASGLCRAVRQEWRWVIHRCRVQ